MKTDKLKYIKISNFYYASDSINTEGKNNSQSRRKYTVGEKYLEIMYLMQDYYSQAMRKSCNSKS
jgi:hypothetical protein